MREWDRERERERETCSWGNEWPVMCVWWSGGVGGGRVEGEAVKVEKRAHIFSVIYHHTISLHMYMYGSLLSMH